MAVEISPRPESVAPQQIIVLGRGMCEGRPTEATAERALAAYNYFEAHRPNLVVFSGGNSQSTEEYDPSRPSEASAMAEIAKLPPEITRIEPHSHNTLANFMLSASLLDPHMRTGIIAHTAQLRRAVYMGRLVLPGGVQPIPAEAYGAKPEPPSIMDTLILLLEKSVLMGVKPGNIDQIRQRASLLSFIKAGFEESFSHTVHNAAQYQARRAA